MADFSARSSSRQFWKPGTLAPGVDVERAEGEGDVIVYNARINLSMKQQRMLLPVYQSRAQILYALEKYQTVVVVGQTGSGKTTQIPQYLHEAGWTAGNRVVACTQPRSVAAQTVAERVAQEMNGQLGVEVGYKVRFDDFTDSSRTRIKYLTDGMLLRETLSDPLLSAYSVIMLDEAHERSVATDILLGIVKKIKRKRKDLRVIISSATMDAHSFKDFFEDNRAKDRSKDTAVILSVEGRQFPVEIFYTRRSVRDYVQGAVDSVNYIHANMPPGDVLVFLTGREEIDRAVADINQGDPNLHALPLYAGLPPAQQLLAFRPAAKGVRKVVVATNIAETSVTIDGIVYVVDSGFAKLKSYNPRTGMSSLVVTPISQASANQRAGRAGRSRPGVCYRLYTEDAFYDIMPERTVPELQRTDLAAVVLQLKALGIDDVLHFDFMSPPPAELLMKALELLYACGALDEYCKLTKPIGSTLAEFPLDPQMARMLMAAGELGCSEEILSIAAMLSIQNVFLAPPTARQAAEMEKLKFAVREGDHLTLLNVFNGFSLNQKNPTWSHDRYINYRALKRAVEIRKQLRRYLVRFNIPIVSAGGDTTLIRKAIVCGYFSQAAQLQPNGHYRTVRGDQKLHIHPSSVLFRDAPAWVIFHEVVETTQFFMRELTVIQPMWLSELAPHFYEYKSKAPGEGRTEAIDSGTSNSASTSSVSEKDMRDMALLMGRSLPPGAGPLPSSLTAGTPSSTSRPARSATSASVNGDDDDDVVILPERPRKTRRLF